MQPARPVALPAPARWRYDWQPISVHPSKMADPSQAYGGAEPSSADVSNYFYDQSRTGYAPLRVVKRSGLPILLSTAGGLAFGPVGAMAGQFAGSVYANELHDEPIDWEGAFRSAAISGVGSAVGGAAGSYVGGLAGPMIGAYGGQTAGQLGGQLVGGATSQIVGSGVKAGLGELLDAPDQPPLVPSGRGLTFPLADPRRVNLPDVQRFMERHRLV